MASLLARCGRRPFGAIRYGNVTLALVPAIDRDQHAVSRLKSTCAGFDTACSGPACAGHGGVSSEHDFL